MGEIKKLRAKIQQTTGAQQYIDVELSETEQPGDSGVFCKNSIVVGSYGINNESHSGNQIIGHNIMAIGDLNTVGQMAFRIIGTNESNKSYKLQTVDGIEVGYQYSIRLTTQAYRFGKVVSVDSTTNTIKVDNYFGGQTAPTSSSYIWFEDYPTIGDIDIGGASLSVGCGFYDDETNSITFNKANLRSVSFGMANDSYGMYSFTTGRQNKAGYSSVAEGRQTSALGEMSHSEGMLTVSLGFYSHAQGHSTVAFGEGSHTEGMSSRVYSGKMDKDSVIAHQDSMEISQKSTIAIGYAAHAEGMNTLSLDTAAHSEGWLTRAIGPQSHSEGYGSISVGIAAHSEGYTTTASGEHSHSEGTGTTSSGSHAHSEGSYTTSSGFASHSEGKSTVSSNTGTHTEGELTQATKTWAHAEGYSTKAFGEASHSEGMGTQCDAPRAHAEGWSCVAGGDSSHAEGYKTQAKGKNSHTEGNSTVVTADNSHAEGVGTTAGSQCQHVEGRYNLVDDKGIYIHIAGWGDDDANRKNVYTLSRQGDGWFSGTLSAEGGYTGSLTRAFGSLSESTQIGHMAPGPGVGIAAPDIWTTRCTLGDVADLVVGIDNKIKTVVTKEYVTSIGFVTEEVVRGIIAEEIGKLNSQS